MHTSQRHVVVTAIGAIVKEGEGEEPTLSLDNWLTVCIRIGARDTIDTVKVAEKRRRLSQMWPYWRGCNAGLSRLPGENLSSCLSSTVTTGNNDIWFDSFPLNLTIRFDPTRSIFHWAWGAPQFSTPTHSRSHRRGSDAFWSMARGLSWSGNDSHAIPIHTTSTWHL